MLVPEALPEPVQGQNDCLDDIPQSAHSPMVLVLSAAVSQCSLERQRDDLGCMSGAFSRPSCAGLSKLLRPLQIIGRTEVEPPVIGEVVYSLCCSRFVLPSMMEFRVKGT